MPIEFASVSALAKAFGRVPLEIRAELRPALKGAANLIADQARINAGYSTRIPGAISTSARVSSRGGAVVRVSVAKAPHAKLLEGLAGNPFRHPVFGNRDVWVPQAAHPYLFPAVRAKREEAKALIAAAVKAATRI